MICYNSQNQSIFLILTCVIFFVSLIDFKLFGYHQLFYEILGGKKIIERKLF